MSDQYNATVTLRADLAPGTMVLRVKLDGEPFSYEAGQYTVLGLLRSSPRIAEASPDSELVSSRPEDYLIKRAYSITSNSKDDELEFVVTLVRSGDLTPRLFNLDQGSRVYVEPRAAGMFTLQTSSGNRDLLLIATGAALAPYLAMIRGAFPLTAEDHFVVVHSAAVSWDLSFRSQLEELSELSDNLTYLPTITDPDRDRTWQGLTGTVEELLQSDQLEDMLGIPITPEQFDVYLSGSPQMIDAVTDLLKERGYSPGDPLDPQTNLLVERYW